MSHESQQAESRRCDRSAKHVVVESVERAQQGGAVEVELLGQGAPLVDQASGSDR
jgi:hypothetical protein